MDLIEELKNIESKSPKQAQEKTVAFLSRVDFSDSNLSEQGTDYIRHILNDYIAVNKPITELQAITMHCILCKQSLTEQGLNDVSIKYHQADGNPPYYRDDENSINFCCNPVIDGSVCCKAYLLDPYCENNEKSEKTRLGYFANRIMALEHEIRHTVQFTQKMESSLDDATPNNYLMAKEHIARLCSLLPGGKYNKNNTNLYSENHDQFLYEIDAYRTGYKRALDRLKTLSSRAYQVAITSERFGEKLNKWNFDLEKYTEIEWKHDTNPNNSGVKANHKASLIIDTTLPKLSSKERSFCFQKYPILSLTYNADGSKKLLEQVEQERDANINELLVSTQVTPVEIQRKVPRIIKIYETAIESDPVLSFERCMKQIAELSWDSNRAYSGEQQQELEDKYNYSKVMKELRAIVEKAEKLATYIEEVDYKTVKQIFSKCKRDLKVSNMHDKNSQRFWLDKQNEMRKIERAIMLNRDFRLIEERDIKEAQKKRMEINQAEEILKKVFPGFEPHKMHFKGITKEGDIEAFNNVEEKLLLEESYKRYTKDVIARAKKTKEPAIVAGVELTTAIKTFYDFEVTEEQRQEFKRKLELGEITPLKNVYSDEGYFEFKQELKPHSSPITENETSQHKKTEQEEDKQQQQQVTPENDVTAKKQEERNGQTIKEEQTYVDEYGVVRQKDDNLKNNHQEINRNFERGMSS